MNRGSRQHAWVCWGVILGSWAVAKVAWLRSLPPDPPVAPHATPPGWVVGICSLTAALFALAAATRRGRACMRMRPRVSRPSRYGNLYIEAIALSELLGAALVATIVFVDWDYDGSTPEVLLHLVRLPDLAALGYVFATVRSVRGPLAEWGWRHGRGVCRELSIGILAGLILRAMDPLLDAVAETDASAWRTRMVLGTVLLAPIIEETLYRGALYRYLRDRMHWLSTAIFSATVFALVHSFPQMHTAYVMGLACALLREWRGSLIAPVAMHASWNLLAMAASGLLTD